jgi:coenzyme F420-reducing hydrogenase beta subunit
MKINIQNETDCCGCSACASICPKSAINMEANVLGFKYPTIDNSRCVDCGKCIQACDFNANSCKEYSNSGNPRSDYPLAFGVRYKDKAELINSQSGGASWAIIELFIKSGGIVYGSCFDTPFKVVHRRAETLEECKKFRGSKYIQSNLDGVFKAIIEDLKKSKPVLFFGTGCQVAGLKSIASRYSEDLLFTVDLVCHAVTAPAVWEDFLHYLEKQYNSKVIKATFRNKRFGWHSHIDTIQLDNNLPELELISFRKLFYDHIIIRKSCIRCPYTSLRRNSDLTIADFWGWEKVNSVWNDNLGVNLLLVNTKKGYEFFKKTDNLLAIQCSIDDCLQPQLQNPIMANSEVLDEAKFVFADGGYKALARRFGDLNWKYRIKGNIRKLLHLIGINR